MSRILIDSAAPFGASSKEARQLVDISFDVTASAPTGDTTLEITEGVISDVRASSLAAIFANGKISISGPNAQGVSISGRVITAEGAGLRNATVTIAGARGEERTVTTGTFGYYRIEGVAAGQTYTVTVASRRFRFTPQRVTPSDNLADLDFTAQE